MGMFSGGVQSITPSTTDDNWTLEADVAGDYAAIRSFGWGGQLTTSTGFVTRWTRAMTAGVGAGTAITTSPHNPNDATNIVPLYSTYATTQPVLETAGVADLHNQGWNAHGGLGYIALPLAAPWVVLNGVGQASINCRNTTGTTATSSSYHTTFEE